MHAFSTNKSMLIYVRLLIMQAFMDHVDHHVDCASLLDIPTSKDIKTDFKPQQSLQGWYTAMSL